MKKTSIISKELIAKWEGVKLEAYLCPANIWTIGVGSTFYPNGNKVKKGDKLNSYADAYILLDTTLQGFEKTVNNLVTSNINQNQFDALVSFTFNVGSANFKTSTLLKKVNKNPNDPTIKGEFGKWIYANKKVLKGLINRRNDEANLYFKK